MASIWWRGVFGMRKILPRPRHEFSMWLGRWSTVREQPEFVVHGSPAHHRAQGVFVNPFGYPPLFDKHQQASTSICKYRNVLASIGGIW